MKLNPQELRNALYPGSLNALLIQLARSENFTQAWGIPKYRPDEESEPSEELANNTLFRSLADAELVLRYFAIADAIESKKGGSLRRILDRFMEKNANADGATIDRLRANFSTCLSRLVTLFDGKPFRLPTTNRPSRPLYDALMLALHRLSDVDLEADAEGIKDRLSTALRDKKKYDVLTGRGNSMESIKARVALANSILTGT